ncbi:MAG: 1-deoxy-D-xylulose-5-phosphate reductoisomerase [Elusimicrobiota bacterium]|nr:1-deoxy-D-xylulose-5-phosphate reductoisomerase [Elusimicrobiota bacterium]
MKRIVVLGSSGSIGGQTLDVVSKLKNISVVGLSVKKNILVLKDQIKKFHPKYVCVGNFDDAKDLKIWLKRNNFKTTVFSGDKGLEEIVSVPNADMIVAAIVGAAGLKSIFKAVKEKKDVAIANKEVLVCAGLELMELSRKNGVKILPVDSEHSAIFQCCCGAKKSQIKKILLTASGGPFYKYKKDFSKITLEQALVHPTWKMGKKITVDSATLMNKGLEAIETSVLFGVPIEKVEILIHPQSTVHSMVEFNDGAVIAQLSNPDMRLPIQYALTYPERVTSNIKSLDLVQLKKLEFFKPDFRKFPCLQLAYDCAKKGLQYPAVLNASNEIAVSAFLNGKIKFTDIARVVNNTVEAYSPSKRISVRTSVNADMWSRNFAISLIDSKISKGCGFS